MAFNAIVLAAFAPAHTEPGVIDMYLFLNLLSLAIAAAGLAYAVNAFKQIMAKDAGDDLMQKIAKSVQDGAKAFLYAEYKWLAVFVAVVFVLLMVGTDNPANGQYLGYRTAIAFLLGCLASATAGYFGMHCATRAAVRTTQAPKTSLGRALAVAHAARHGPRARARAHRVRPYAAAARLPPSTSHFRLPPPTSTSHLSPPTFDLPVPNPHFPPASVLPYIAEPQGTSAKFSLILIQSAVALTRAARVRGDCRAVRWAVRQATAAEGRRAATG